MGAAKEGAKESSVPGLKARRVNVRRVNVRVVNVRVVNARRVLVEQW